MTPKQKAIQLVDEFRLILINSETDVSEEILCTSIAKQCALVVVDKMEIVERNVLLKFNLISEDTVMHYWQLVKNEIENL